MNALEYLIKDAEKCISQDEFGSMYADITSESSFAITDFIASVATWSGYGMYFFDDATKNELRQYEIIVRDTEYPKNVENPYYRLRGRPVTKEQAFDIIRRTDNFLSCISKIEGHEDFVYGKNFSNFIFDRDKYQCIYGWAHVEGEIGLNEAMDNYPTRHEFIYEWLYKLIRFPYLELVIAFADWDIIPEDAGRYEYMDLYRKVPEYEFPEHDQEFYNAVVFGVHIHNKKIEILNAEDAVRVYKDYAALYGENQEKFSKGYYRKHGIEPDLDYLKKCIESYGFDADAVLRSRWGNAWNKEGKK